MEDRILAIVNDGIITESDLKNSSIFPHRTLSSVIENKLQLQIANKNGIYISQAEIMAAIDNIKKNNSFLSDEEFNSALSKQGISLEAYQNDLREQLTLIKLVNKEVKSNITLTDKELESYYQQNKDYFSEPEEIRVGYILVSFKPDESAEAKRGAQELIENILSDIRNNKMSLSDIKDLYKNKQEVNVVEDLGFVKKGTLLREIDQVAFSLAEGEISNIITSPSGFYLIKIIEKKGFEYKPFQEVKDLVKERLFYEKNDQLFRKWIYEKKTSAYIEIKTDVSF